MLNIFKKVDLKDKTIRDLENLVTGLKTRINELENDKNNLIALNEDLKKHILEIEDKKIIVKKTVKKTKGVE